MGSGQESYGNGNMNLTKAFLVPSSACFEIALCVIHFCKAEVRFLTLFSICGADNCQYFIDSCSSLWYTSGNKWRSANLSSFSSLFFIFFFKNKRQPQSPTRTVTGKFENVTQMPPYYQAQESGCKRNKPNPSFNLGSFKPVSFYLDLKYDLDYLGMGNNKVFLSSLREGDTLLSFQFSWGQFLIQVGSLSLAHETFNATIILKRIRKILAITWEKRIFLPLILFLLFFYRFLLLVVTQLCLHTTKLG